METIYTILVVAGVIILAMKFDDNVVSFSLTNIIALAVECSDLISLSYIILLFAWILSTMVRMSWRDTN